MCDKVEVTKRKWLKRVRLMSFCYVLCVFCSFSSVEASVSVVIFAIIQRICFAVSCCQIQTRCELWVYHTASIHFTIDLLCIVWIYLASRGTCLFVCLLFYFITSVCIDESNQSTFDAENSGSSACL